MFLSYTTIILYGPYYDLFWSNELAKTNDSCNNSCNENATCVDGECQCKPGYVGNGKVCLPGGLFTEIKPTVALTTNEGTYLIFNDRLIIICS